MGIRAPWLLLGSATSIMVCAACGLSVGGTSLERPGESGGVDATDQGEGSASTIDGSPASDRDGSDASAPRDARAHDAAGDVSEDRDAAIHGDALEDSQSDAGADVEADDGGAADATTDVVSGPCADGSPGCVVVPPGWTLVAFAANQGSACPGGFGPPTDLVEGPDTTAACACGTCSVTQQASCASGSVSVYYDTSTGSQRGTCSLPGTVTPLGNSPAGACATDIYKGSYGTYDIKYVPPAATGGACTSTGTASGSVSYAAHDRACSPVSAQAAGCVGNACMPSLGAGYQACITQLGQSPCPAGPLGVHHLVGSAATYACSACGCSVTAQCTGTVTLYSDNKCSKKALAVPADGSCNNISTLAMGNAVTVGAYTYTGGTPSMQCAPTGSSSAQNVSLTNASTVCCAQ